MAKTNVARGRFEDIVATYVDVLMEKQPKYGDSWRRRNHSPGDNLSRKWDRIEQALEAHNWNIWDALRADPTDTGLIDDIRDLANYCILIHEHAIATSILGYPVERVNADIAARDEVGTRNTNTHLRAKMICPACHPHPGHLGGQCKESVNVGGEDTVICDCQFTVEVDKLQEAKDANPGSDVRCSNCGGNEEYHAEMNLGWPCVGAKRIVQLAGNLILKRARVGLEP